MALDSTFLYCLPQVDMSTTRRYGGTGLGLHLVREIVRAHGGEIQVGSKLGEGASFTVWLPVKVRAIVFVLGFCFCVFVGGPAIHSAALCALCAVCVRFCECFL